MTGFGVVALRWVEAIGSMQRAGETLLGHCLALERGSWVLRPIAGRVFLIIIWNVVNIWVTDSPAYGVFPCIFCVAYT